MYLKEYYPSQFFSKYIDSYFTIDCSLINSDITDLVIPDGTFGLLFTEESEISRSTSTCTAPEKIKRSTLFGQKTKPVNYLFSSGSNCVFGIKINPCGFHFFTNIACKDFKNFSIEIDLVNNSTLIDLEDQVLNAPNTDKKIEVIEDYIHNKLKKNALDDDHYLFERIVSHIYTLKGEVRFSDLTDYFNLNYKKVERLFNKYLGISPKTYIRIVRFNASIHLFKTTNNNSLTQLGLESGFFDQSHFIRDFKSFTSLTPKNFFDKKMSLSEETYLKMITERW